MERVSSEPEFSPPFSDAEKAQLFAVYELCAASDAGGLVSYFTSEAASYFQEALAWLCEKGIDQAWVNFAREAFDGEIPCETEDRIERLSARDGWSAGIDPFEEAQRKFEKTRPQIDDEMNRAVGNKRDRLR